MSEELFPSNNGCIGRIDDELKRLTGELTDDLPDADKKELNKVINYTYELRATVIKSSNCGYNNCRYVNNCQINIETLLENCFTT